MEEAEEEMGMLIIIRNISKPGAVLACTAMSLLYVAILYSPTLILRLAPPNSFNRFMIRRFLCAALSSLISLFLSSLLLFPIRTWKIMYLLAPYGIQAVHMWQAVVFPISLTSLMYAGSLVLKSILLLDSWNVDGNDGISSSYISSGFYKIYGVMTSLACNIAAWRNLVVAPITEELVFRACMIPVLLCGGFKPQTVVFICPIFFSLAHLNHLLELYSRKNHSVVKTSIAVGTQLAYTMVFGSYASFLFIRTGHLIAPLVAHVVCNFMGLPVVYSRRKGAVVCLAFVVGTISFLWLLFPLTSPALYNNRLDNCRCWHGYCSWPN